ncbi:MAG TPA: glycosyltransferase family 2 protein [Lacipirellulaceae bacterium]|nr:glycosyltransferase family 2 protein [Lacipirellulaceae bacterium]
MLDHITPVILTHNEEQNIGRTLSRLGWAKDIVVVDSGSTDRTLAILTDFPNVRLFKRPFDSHATQWRFAIGQTQIATAWILRLDADYQISDAFVSELARLDPDAPVSAYRVTFDYAIFSHKLLSSLYPPNTILLRKDCCSVWDDGHTERWDVNGPVVALHARVVHDDWKPTGQWLVSQTRYMQRELDRLPASGTGMRHWLRLRPPLMPIAVFLYCLFGKGLIFNGRAGLFYALQRMIAEAVLSLLLLEAKLRDRAGGQSSLGPYQ